MSTVIELLIVLGIMVLVHEFGHFAVAKLCGIRVETFSIGFGKRLFGFVHGGTDYRISILPLGGYVKMAGDNPGEAPSGDPGEFNAHPRWQRMLVALAGPVSNFILAFALMTGVSMLHNEVQEYLSGPAPPTTSPTTPSPPAPACSPATPSSTTTTSKTPPGSRSASAPSSTSTRPSPSPSSTTASAKTPPSTSKTRATRKTSPSTSSASSPRCSKPRLPSSASTGEETLPAARAGIEPGDQIESIDGLHLHSVSALLAYLQDSAGKPVSLVIDRHGSAIPVTLTPVLGDAGDGTRYYQLGFHPTKPPVKVERLPLAQAVEASWKFNKKASLLIGEVLHRMFTRQVSVKSLSGPIGIGTQIHEAVQMPGWMPLIGTMALISLNLGIFNLLPIPILDGGMILFLIIESIMRRDVNQQIKERVYQVAFVCLIAFAAFVIFNDITKLGLFSHLKS